MRVLAYVACAVVIFAALVGAVLGLTRASTTAGLAFALIAAVSLVPYVVVRFADRIRGMFDKGETS